jgi:hypothetical protein
VERFRKAASGAMWRYWSRLRSAHCAPGLGVACIKTTNRTAEFQSMFKSKSITGKGERFGISALYVSVFGFEKILFCHLTAFKNSWFGKIEFSVRLNPIYFLQIHRIFGFADPWKNCLSGDDFNDFQGRLIDDFCAFFFFDLLDENNIFRKAGPHALGQIQMDHYLELLALAKTYSSFRLNSTPKP